MTFPDRLRQVVPDRGFTMAEVARLAGMSRQALHPIASGKNPAPTLPVLKRIADAMGLSLSELFEGVDEA